MPGLPDSFAQPRGMVVRDAGKTLVEQLVAWIQRRVNDGAIPAGTRMPSIRDLAAQQSVSRFTVVHAYERLVAAGCLESRPGSGFFVRQPRSLNSARKTPRRGTPTVDVSWLMHNLFRDLPAEMMPGSGLLPAEWMDRELISSGLRAVGRHNLQTMLRYGMPRGYLPLRNQLQLKLSEIEIEAKPDQILVTSGATHAMDLVFRQLLHPGDVVFVEDPGWYVMFGSLASMGMQVIGVPRLADGPDLDMLEVLFKSHRPKLFIVNSILHNPTGTSLSAQKAHQLLKIADAHDFMILENDVYADFTDESAIRMASLDQLQRVIYVGSFAKTLAANLRVGFIAGSHELTQQLTYQKMLSGLTSSETSERVVHKILSEGHFRKHVQRLRARIDSVREASLDQLASTGLRIPVAPAHGLLLWADLGVDANRIAAAAWDEGYVFAPGSLFSPTHAPSTWMRFNITTSSNPKMLQFLKSQLEIASRQNPKKSVPS